jgi:hypothetical protein
MRTALLRVAIGIGCVIVVLLVLFSVRVSKRMNALQELETNGFIVTISDSRVTKWLKRNNASPSLIRAVHASSRVQVVSIEGFLASWKHGLDALRYFPEVRVLELRGEGITNSHLSVLEDLRDLQEFCCACFVEGDALDDQGLRKLRFCTQLRAITLEWIQTDGEFLSEIPSPELLSELTIIGSEYFDDASLERLMRFPNLRELNLLGCLWLTSECCPIFGKLKSLNSLTIRLPSEDCRVHVMHVPNLSIDGVSEP